MTTFAPTMLATPTDLSAKEVQAVSQSLNALIADALALYIKTKNYHWHLYGASFKELHELFDTHAEQLLESVDPLAERVRKLGATTLHSISQIAKLQQIKDDEDDLVKPLEMVKRLLSDNQHMARCQRTAISVCEENNDTVSSDVLQSYLDQTERRVWFLFEIAQGEARQ